ncbi:MAG: HesA/MoeB/ThiF family protein [Desulfocapsaceae bacterium]|nr:HesA/MoeB/ThiF family protein [Desulfocapsaceae bacterium]
MPVFSKEQLERYSRQILLKDIGVNGQERLRSARILLVGVGGLGSPVSLYLAAAGVGTLGLIDGDTVDLSNLQRQVVHYTKDIGKAKVDSAKEKLLALNPEVNLRIYYRRLQAGDIAEIIGAYDFIIDGTDDFPTKFLINDACISAGIPFSHGGILQYDGQTMTVLPGKSTCYRCVFRHPPPYDIANTCSKAGILGAVAGMLGTIQAAEALKFVTGVGTLLTDTLLTFNALTMDFRKISLKRRPDCAACGLTNE